MSVKSTRNLTRDAAIDMYIRLLVESEPFRSNLRQVISAKSDSSIEDELMEMNDAAHDGECFENYRIVPDDWADDA